MLDITRAWRKLKNHRIAVSQDQLICHGAHRVNDYYKGYPYVFVIPWRSFNNSYWSQFPDNYEAMDEIVKWCKAQEFPHFRDDIFRVSQSTGSTMATDGDWVFDEMGGGDCRFIAFTREEDLIWFTIRYGHVANTAD